MIKVLSKDIVNKIAAGEVVERPASVVKELVENSIDAGATEIQVLIEDFGTKRIQIIDNGTGIRKEDFKDLFKKHATSKISDIEDLESIASYGFRGEALASISSVSELELITKHDSDEIGTQINLENGKVSSEKPASIQKGTNFNVINLFSNIPARKKFLKSKSTENKAILDVLNKYILANPNISFTITIDGTTKSFNKAESKDRIAQIFRINAEDLIPLFNDSNIKISGFAVHPRNFIKSRSYQYIFVNNRPISDNTIVKAIIDGYDTFLMKHQYPGYVIFLNLDPKDVDVNVHPRKTEIRFINPQDVYRAVRSSVNSALVKHLKKETLDRLAKSEVNDQIEDYSPVTNSNQKIETQDLSSFEDFLNEPSKTKDFVSKKDSKEINKQAILFNEEISSVQVTSSSKLNLDLENATQLLNSYILTSSDEEILIIDQHAASERYFYEKYLSELRTKKVRSKVLLIPEIYKFDDFEVIEIEKFSKVFEEFGFRFEVFGKDEIRITEVPDFLKMNDFGKVFKRIVFDILSDSEIGNIQDKLRHEIAAILACHTAVRFGDKLNRTEITQILKNLITCEDPYNCPHGRPIIQDFEKYEVEKKFKRCGI